MKVFTYSDSEARQNFAKLLDIAQKEEVQIRRKDGTVFSLVSKKPAAKSPFDVPGVDTSVSTQDILDVVREVRRGNEPV